MINNTHIIKEITCYPHIILLKSSCKNTILINLLEKNRGTLPEAHVPRCFYKIKKVSNFRGILGLALDTQRLMDFPLPLTSNRATRALRVSFISYGAGKYHTSLNGHLPLFLLMDISCLRLSNRQLPVYHI